MKNLFAILAVALMCSGCWGHDHYEPYSSEDCRVEKHKIAQAEHCVVSCSESVFAIFVGAARSIAYTIPCEGVEVGDKVIVISSE